MLQATLASRDAVKFASRRGHGGSFGKVIEGLDSHWLGFPSPSFLGV